MGERCNTVDCCFDPRSPRINAFQVHEWIYDRLQLPEENIRAIQIDGFKRSVYIKFSNEDSMYDLLWATDGLMDSKHDNGEISKVANEIAGMEHIKVRIANLPPETKEHDIRNNLSKYGEVKVIMDEMWAPRYRNKVSNCMKVVDMRIKQHLPSHLLIAGNDALLSYDGQSPTCCRCNAVGHNGQDCPRGRPPSSTQALPHKNTWAEIVTGHRRRLGSLTPF